MFRDTHFSRRMSTSDRYRYIDNTGIAAKYQRDKHVLAYHNAYVKRQEQYQLGLMLLRDAYDTKSKGEPFAVGSTKTRYSARIEEVFRNYCNFPNIVKQLRDEQKLWLRRKFNNAFRQLVRDKSIEASFIEPINTDIALSGWHGVQLLNQYFTAGNREPLLVLTKRILECPGFRAGVENYWTRKEMSDLRSLIIMSYNELNPDMTKERLLSELKGEAPPAVSKAFFADNAELNTFYTGLWESDFPVIKTWIQSVLNFPPQ